MVDFIGAARDPQFRQDVGRGLVDSFGRGLSMIGGAPVDLTTMFLRPLGYSVPDEQIVGSSEYIGRQMANLGLISETRNPVAEFLSALLIPDPTDIQKLAPYVQKAMNADLVAPRPSTPGAAMMAQRGSVGVEPSGKAEDDLPVMTGLNPTGSVFVGYTPHIRATQPLAENMVTVDRTMGGSPDDMITIYRGAPTKQKKIVPGDFVTDDPRLARDYAGSGHVIKMKVRKGDLLDDMTEPSYGAEYIYRPEVSPPRPKAPREEALRIAQENAAKPVSEGGLGLPPDNTAMDRARAMGFDVEAFHASDADIRAFDPERLGELTEINTGGDEWAMNLAKRGHWFSDRDLAEEMASNVSYPVLIQRPTERYGSLDELAMETNTPPVLRVADEEFGTTSYVVQNPYDIRSRFAAFDPARRYESDLLGSVDPRLLAILGPAAVASIYGLGELYANQRRDKQTR